MDLKSGSERELPATIVGFEGLRGTLALSVCLGHYGINALFRPLGLYLNFDLSVDVFFALSGFVLSHTGYFGERSRTDFVIRRFARLYPLHLLSFLAVLAIYQWHQWPIRPAFVIQTLSLLQNVGLPPQLMSFNFPGWSISVEFWVSIIFVATLTGVASPRRLFFALLAIVGLVILLAPSFQLMKSENIVGYINGGLLRGIVGFSVGVAAYLYCRHIDPEYAPSRWPCYAASLLLLAIFLKPWHSPTDSWLLYTCIFTLLVSICKCREPSMLSSHGLVVLGTASYSIYLLHIPLLLTLEALFSIDALHGARKLIAISILLPLALVVNRHIERPAQRNILRMFSGRRLPAMQGR